MDQHPDVDHSFTSSVLQKITLEDHTFHRIYSKSASNQGPIHIVAAEDTPLAKETRANYGGLPSRHEFTAAIDAYLSALSSKKLSKALITQQLYEDIIFNLRREKDSLPGIGTPQFRFWCRDSPFGDHPSDWTLDMMMVTRAKLRRSPTRTNLW
ncbi:hypothetical protein RSAG8_02606, partial [Rhizoctonia solani AG-8 WAC10335]